MSKVSSKFDRIIQNVDSVVGDYVSNVGSDVYKTIIEHTPVDTGHLRDSIELNKKKYSSNITTKCEYALIVELGTATRPAQPFFEPGYLVGVASREHMLRILKAQLMKGV